ncbi:MAG: macro domain-containing protein [Methanobrevibacter sp.]|nr:macro domain-containing protein [Methanobrevibacter sp.]
MKSSIEVKQIGITELDVDVIVNAANSLLQMGGGVCGAIFHEAGPNELTEACNEIGGCNTGEAVITPGFNLKSDYIIHAVGPVWNGGDNNEEELLYGAYINSLKLAKEHDCRSIGFPVISSGIYGYPKREAWEVAIRACNDFISNNPDYSIKIIFAVLSSESRFMGESAIKDSSKNDFNQVLKKIEDNLYELLNKLFHQNYYERDEIKITEKLFKKQEALHVPFGFLSYFLVMEDDKPVLYVRVATRMDIDSIGFVDENGDEGYDVYFGDHRDIVDKYNRHLQNVEKFKGLKMPRSKMDK